MPDPDRHEEEQLREELPEDESDAVIDATEHNSDPTTRRETMEQELMELHRSDVGSDVGE